MACFGMGDSFQTLRVVGIITSCPVPVVLRESLWDWLVWSKERYWGLIFVRKATTILLNIAKKKAEAGQILSKLTQNIKICKNWNFFLWYTFSYYMYWKEKVVNNLIFYKCINTYQVLLITEYIYIFFK